MKQLMAGGLILVGLLTVVSCGGDEDTPADRTSEEGGGAMTRTFYMEALEPKGGTSLDKEAFPDAALPPGGGYALKEPDDEGKWEVETYIWNPKQIVVNEGDTVQLEILGVNGAKHEGSIEGYVSSFVVERGKITSLSFVAEKAGVFKIGCSTHPPSMTAELVVLPRT